MTNILKKTRYLVESEGVLVKLSVGNIPITMDYETALSIAQDLRIMGRRSKACAGDTSREIRGKAYLSDAEQDELRIQKHRTF